MPFRDVVGHQRLVGLLARAILRDSLPPSLILAGPAGVGKRLIGTSIAQALNCTNRQSLVRGDPSAGADACGVCAACVRIARSTHPDVLIVEPGDSGSIKVEQAREVTERTGYRPFEGRKRVVIIDDADALVPAAQNALLKTLEEPPSSSMFLLVTARPDALLPTVQSRCPRLRFWPLSAMEIATVLLRQGHAAGEANVAAASANGSVTQALAADAGDLDELRTVAAAALTEAAGAADARRRLEAAKTLVGKSGGFASERVQLAAELRVMASLLRDVEAEKAQGARASLANPDVAPSLKRLASFRGERGVRAFDAVQEALQALERNASAKIVADWLMLRL
jgi:DNA polymerase-3 subunit delta'